MPEGACCTQPCYVDPAGIYAAHAVREPGMHCLNRRLIGHVRGRKAFSAALYLSICLSITRDIDGEHVVAAGTARRAGVRLCARWGEVQT